MNQFTYVIPRASMDEATYATMLVEFTAEAIGRGDSGILQLKQRLIEACSDWAKHSDEGRRAWEEAAGSFNIGDLSNQDLDPINGRLKQHGLQVLSLETYSMDERPDQWVFDDVLIDAGRLD